MELPKKRVLSCVRVSGKVKVDGISIPGQQQKIQFLCKEYHLEVVEEFKFEFLSGAHVESSPEFRRMLATLERDDIHGLVCVAVDRLFRPAFLHDFTITKVFAIKRKMMWCDCGPVDVTTEIGQQTLMMRAMAANLERRLIRARTHGAKELSRQDPSRKTDPLPKGVEFVPDDRAGKTGSFRYTPQAERVRTAVTKLLRGETMIAVAQDCGFTSATALRATLRSRWWIGEKAVTRKRVGAHYTDDGRFHEGAKKDREPELQIIKQTNLANSPLISREDWYAIQALLNQRRKCWQQRRSHNHKYLGGNLLYCPCGEKLYHKTDNRPGKPSYYLCATNYNGKKKCGYPMFPAATVDRELRVHVIFRLTSPNYLKQLTPEQVVSNAAELQTRIKGLSTKKDRLVRSLEDLEDEEAAQARRRIKEIKTEIEALNEELKQKPAEKKIDIAALKRRFTNFRKLEMKEQKQLLSEVFSKAHLMEDGSIARIDLK